MMISKTITASNDRQEKIILSINITFNVVQITWFCRQFVGFRRTTATRPLFRVLPDIIKGQC